LGRAFTAVWVPDERHEAMRDLSRARQAVKKDLQGKRQQISSLMLRLGRIYPGKTTWGPAHMKWLMAQKRSIASSASHSKSYLRDTPGKRARRAFGKHHPRGGARVVARRDCRGAAGRAGD
jgi:hypothetical protein